MKSRYMLLFITIVAVLILTPPLISILQRPAEQEYQLIKEENALLIQDDFSRDPAARWVLLKDAYWNSREGNLVLATTRQGDTGAIWLKNGVTQPFTVEFAYYVGGGNGGNGFVFMFYKEGDYDPGMGRYIGFACRPEKNRPCPQKDAPGYGVEWDTLYNNGYGLGDPSPSHIALIKDNVNHHLTYVNDTTTKDNRWHRAKVVIKEDTIQVYVDQKLVLRWTGTLNRTYSRTGFGASSMVHFDWHIIDDFKLYGNTVKITGLQPGWRVELYGNTKLIAKTTALSDSNEAVIDVTEVSIPLKGYFKITNETGEVVFESQTFSEIWGGDTLTLHKTLQQGP